VEAAVNEAIQTQTPEPSQMFDHVFSELTPRQRVQRRSLLGAE
jgi:TPP-dependent pyruvate/acetoin dehydrogenase alpha subunit